MLFKRVLSTNNSGLPQIGRQGQGLMANIDITSKTTDANHTLTVAEMSGGMVYYSALSAGRSVTANCRPDSGCRAGYGHWRFVLILRVDSGCFRNHLDYQYWRDSGWSATTPASSWSLITVTKLTATTVQWHVS
jgi:hypothetical protein